MQVQGQPGQLSEVLSQTKKQRGLEVYLSSRAPLGLSPSTENKQPNKSHTLGTVVGDAIAWHGGFPWFGPGPL